MTPHLAAQGASDFHLRRQARMLLLRVDVQLLVEAELFPAVLAREVGHTLTRSGSLLILAGDEAMKHT